MRLSDIDMSADLWEYRLEKHKSAYRGKDRVIPLGPQAQEVIKPFLKADRSAYLFSPAGAGQGQFEDSELLWGETHSQSSPRRVTTYTRFAR